MFMSEEIKIENHKKQLGKDYFLVKIIWDEICKTDFCFECSDPLKKNEQPVDECTELEKILLACIVYLEDAEEKALLTRIFLLTAYQQHQITFGAVIRVRKSFLIVVE